MVEDNRHNSKGIAEAFKFLIRGIKESSHTLACPQLAPVAFVGILPVLVLLGNFSASFNPCIPVSCLLRRNCWFLRDIDIVKNLPQRNKTQQPRRALCGKKKRALIVC
jgi:hypothetical protein